MQQKWTPSLIKRLSQLLKVWVFVLLSATTAQAVDYVFPTQQGPFNLQSGDTLTIASGTYSGSLNNIPSNTTVFVNSGATLAQNNLNVNLPGLKSEASGSPSAFRPV